MSAVSERCVRYEALLRTSSALAVRRSLPEVLQVLSVEMRQLVHFDFLLLMLHDEENSHPAWYAMSAEDVLDAVVEPSLVGQIARWTFERWERIALPCDGEHPLFQVGQALVAEGTHSVCAFPLSKLDRRIGSMTLCSSKAGSYGEGEIDFLSFVADQVAIAIDNGQAYDRTAAPESEWERTNKRLQLILDVNNSIAANLSLSGLLRAVSASIRAILQCDGAGVSIAEENHLRFYAMDFPSNVGVAKEGFLMPIEGTPLGDVLKARTPSLHKISPEVTDGMAGPEGIRFGCAAPLVSRGRALGVLSAGRRGNKAFTTEDLELLTQVSRQVAIALDNSIAYEQINSLKNQLAQEKVYLEDEIRSEMGFEEIIGRSGVLREVLKQVEIVAPTESTVLIFGETGTGKELIARAVHNLSHRKPRAFVKLNCAAIPTGLLESELFGHEKGAFTGAIAQRIGRFELANQGTIFLDEIGEVSLELQPKLLRVIQEGEFERLGSSRTLRSDARLIAATNRDLGAMAGEGRFRPDLFYRLNVFPIRLPPLRERVEDIPLLVNHFVRLFSRRMGKAIESVPSEAMAALVRHDWPGNIRELQNVIERAVILTQGSVLKVLTGELRTGSSEQAQPLQKESGIRTLLEDAERKEILKALEQASWVVSGPGGAATKLGLKRSTLQLRMQKLGIRVTKTGRAQ